MKPSEWIEKAKIKKKLSSDYQLAKKIGINNSGLANLKRRNKGMDNYTAIKIAELLEIDRLKIIIDIELQKAKTEEKKKFWKEKQEIYK